MSTDFWLAVALVAIIILSVRKATYIAARYLDAKIDTISRELDEAKNIKIDAEQLLLALETEYKTVEQRCLSMVDQSKASSKRTLENLEQEMQILQKKRMALIAEEMKYNERNMLLQIKKALFTQALNNVMTILTDNINHVSAFIVDNKYDKATITTHMRDYGGGQKLHMNADQLNLVHSIDIDSKSLNVLQCKEQ